MFNPFDCEGKFRKIPEQPADGLANQISRTVEEFRKGKSEKKADEDQTKAPGKRKLSPLYSAVPSKKQKVVESSHMKGIQERCNECQLDSKYSLFYQYRHLLMAFAPTFYSGKK